MVKIHCGQHCRRFQLWKKLSVTLSVFFAVYFIWIAGFRLTVSPNSWIDKVILSKKRDHTMANYQHRSQSQGDVEYEGYQDFNSDNGAVPESSNMNDSIHHEREEYNEGGPFYDFPPPKHPPPPPPPPPSPPRQGPLKSNPESRKSKEKKTSFINLDRLEFYSEQRTRKALLRDQCKNHTPPKLQSSPTLSHMMLMDHKHKLIFCYIPKVGCTFFKRLMTVLNGKSPVAVDPYSISANSIHMLPMDYLPEAPKKKKEMLQHYHKMLFVRDPYVRLFSGYLDKMFTARPSIFKLSSYIIKTFRPRSTSLERKCPIDVTFEELIRYVLHSNSHNQHPNYHFQPMHTLCNVCGLNYDVIGKLETFTNDVFFAMESINQTEHLPKGDFRLARMEDDLRTVVNYAFQAKKDICMPFGERLRRLWRRAQIRGFLSLDLKFPLTNAEAMTITNQEFRDLIIDAHFKSREDPTLLANKLEAMIQLYSKVPMHLLNKLQKLFETDCILFGYDPKPDIVFKRDLLRSSPFNYFDLINVR